MGALGFNQTEKDDDEDLYHKLCKYSHPSELLILDMLASAIVEDLAGYVLPSESVRVVQ